MKLTIEVNLDNAAYHPFDDKDEIAWLDVAQDLREAADTIGSGAAYHFEGGKIKDGNGVTVGQWEIT